MDGRSSRARATRAWRAVCTHGMWGEGGPILVSSVPGQPGGQDWTLPDFHSALLYSILPEINAGPKIKLPGARSPNRSEHSPAAAENHQDQSESYECERRRLRSGCSQVVAEPDLVEIALRHTGCANLYQHDGESLTRKRVCHWRIVGSGHRCPVAGCGIAIGGGDDRTACQ